MTTNATAGGARITAGRAPRTLLELIVNQTDPTADFDGCRRACRQQGAHTLVRGECEHAAEPEPTVSLSRVCTAADGFPSMVFDRYTVPQLAELIEPALRRVAVRLGPNALGMLERGEPVRLSGGEYADLAREAAHAIVHRNDEPAAASAVVSPPTNRAALRDRIRRVLAQADGYDFESLEPHDYQIQAAALLAVLPEPTDRAAEELAKHVARAIWALKSPAPSGSQHYRSGWDDGLEAAMDAARDAVLAVEAHGTGTQQPEAEAHEPEHSWAAELYDPATGEWAPTYTSHVRDRAVNALEHGRRIGPTWKDGTPTRRRLVRATTTYTVEEPAPVAQQPAAEAPRTTWTPGPVAVGRAADWTRSRTNALLATPCDACEHTLNWHRNDVGCTVPDCVCSRFREPVTP